MKERPILMSAPMVRALLAGTKTQTRRIMKPQPSDYRVETVAPQALRGEKPKHERPYFDAYNGGPHWCWWDEYDRQGRDWIKCPYGVPGDRLWVREAWTKVPATAYRMSEGVQQVVNPDDRDEAAIFAAGWDRSIPKWKPSIHMPRWASRLTLEITDVRVERLRAISEADALAEGIQEPSLVPLLGAFWSSRDGYAKLWEHINGKGSWAANPWVWALSLKRVPA